ILPETKDIWAVDYMPLQADRNKFLQFVYNPDYLQYKKWLPTISNPNKICEKIDVTTIKTEIVLDGGNVVKSKNKAIICEKVFAENKEYARVELINKIQDLLEVENIIIIPQQPKDIIGHADGMVRFLDENTVLVNDYKHEPKTFINNLHDILIGANLEIIKIPYYPYENKNYNQANGEYINFLLMEQALIVPTFKLKTDDEALIQFDKLFPNKEVVTIECNEI